MGGSLISTSSPSEAEAFGYIEKSSVGEWQVLMFDEVS